jgi:hypothetical protein
MANKKKRKRETAFVPTVVFTTAVLGVIPACAVGCGGQASSSKSTGDAATSPSDATYTPDQFLGGVGYCAFCDGPYLTVAAIGFDSGNGAASDAGSESGSEPGLDASTDSGDEG